MATANPKIPVIYSSVTELIEECEKNKKMATFYLQKDGKVLNEESKLLVLPLYSVTNKNFGKDGKIISYMKNRTVNYFEKEFVKFDVTPKEQQKFDQICIVVSEYFRGPKGLHIKSKLFELIECIEMQIENQIKKFLNQGYLTEKEVDEKEDRFQIKSTKILSPIVSGKGKGKGSRYIRLKLKFGDGNELDNKIKDYGETPYLPYATLHGKPLYESTCHKIKAGFKISGLLSLESIYCSPSGISIPLKITSLTADSNGVKEKNIDIDLDLDSDKEEKQKEKPKAKPRKSGKKGDGYDKFLSLT